ncbi:hypothetical protein [McMurdo Ice Shelf pond-associated circular DNA virus-2]|uniref:hypothetical protein n=1 Tax=McMurdo Ice Shelf pond-associated circular DNA virus-2 TaxID=1521386 RepID=UPI0004D0BD10|nr:hypothetical protein [McMurdo Ice Shelf pond-associated circular DNA virus-2]AIF71506.1 hypothetical protein [McMurdo Ice Shelf pond-associated circular DNA virus-2]
MEPIVDVRDRPTGTGIEWIDSLANVFREQHRNIFDTMEAITGVQTCSRGNEEGDGFTCHRILQKRRDEAARARNIVRIRENNGGIGKKKIAGFPIQEGFKLSELRRQYSHYKGRSSERLCDIPQPSHVYTESDFQTSVEQDSWPRLQPRTLPGGNIEYTCSNFHGEKWTGEDAICDQPLQGSANSKSH